MRPIKEAVKKNQVNDIGGTHKVNGEFSGPGYTHNLSHLFFLLYFLSSFLSSYFSPFQVSASSQGFSFRDHGAGLMGSVNTNITNKSF